MLIFTIRKLEWWRYVNESFSTAKQFLLTPILQYAFKHRINYLLISFVPNGSEIIFWDPFIYDICNNISIIFFNTDYVILRVKRGCNCVLLTWLTKKKIWCLMKCSFCRLQMKREELINEQIWTNKCRISNFKDMYSIYIIPVAMITLTYPNDITS